MEISDKESLINHISKEIEIQTNNMMTFRTRANLPVFLGPFVLLSSVVISAKGVPLTVHFDGLTVTAFVGLALSYLAMGLAAAGIESQMWDQCNKWRTLIAKLAGSSTSEAEIESALIFTPKLIRGYMAVYSSMFLAFVCAIVLILQLK